MGAAAELQVLRLPALFRRFGFAASNHVDPHYPFLSSVCGNFYFLQWLGCLDSPKLRARPNLAVTIPAFWTLSEIL